jgi:hypothetical protein
MVSASARTLVAFGCAMLASSYAPRAASNSLPFSGTFIEQLSIAGPFSEGSVDRCNANLTGAGGHPGFFLTLVGLGEGQFTHLGRTTVSATSCLSPDSLLNVEGEGVLTAANGDMVFITFENTTVPTGDPDIVEVEGTQSIVGGTGRFEGASGDQTCHFEVRLSTGQNVGGCRGEIELPSPH